MRKIGVIAVLIIVATLALSSYVSQRNVPTTGTTPSTGVGVAGPLITGRDWNRMTLSQKTVWIDTALTALIIGGELEQSERLSIDYYIGRLDRVFYDPGSEIKLVAWELTAFTASAPTTGSASSVLLREDFDDGLAQLFGNESGHWVVAHGAYTATSRGSESFSLAGSPDWTDYRLEADLINVTDVALIVRAQGTANYICLAIRPTSCDWRIRTVGPTGQPQTSGAINSVPIPAHDTKTIRVAVEVRGDEFFGYVNGELKTTMKSTLFPRGKVGFTMGTQPNGYIDNVIVYGTIP